MAMALSRPSTCGNRPAYLDKLFHDSAPPVPTVPTSIPTNTPTSPSLRSVPSLRSAKSSFSSSSNLALDSRPVHQSNPRALSPAFEEDMQDDKMSIKSLKLRLNPRNKIRNILNRRTYPRVKETVEFNSTKSSSSCDLFAARQPSLPKLQTTFSSPPQKGHKHSTSKPLPPTPTTKAAEELQCQPCYYFAARNCNGYVMGGNHGDACEGCAVRKPLGSIQNRTR